VSILPQVSVIMPLNGHRHGIGRALDSLAAQSLRNWELLVVGDSAPRALPHDARIRRIGLPTAACVGQAINEAMERSRAPLLAYLPAGGIYYPDHLRDLADCLAASPAAVLAYAGLRERRGNSGLQLIQCMHRRTPWRMHAGTDDPGHWLWTRLRNGGAVEYSGSASCDWGGA